MTWELSRKFDYLISSSFLFRLWYFRNWVGNCIRVYSFSLFVRSWISQTLWVELSSHTLCPWLLEVTGCDWSVGCFRALTAVGDSTWSSLLLLVYQVAKGWPALLMSFGHIGCHTSEAFSNVRLGVRLHRFIRGLLLFTKLSYQTVESFGIIWVDH